MVVQERKTLRHEIDKAADALAKIVQPRIKDSGTAWYSSQDLQQAIESCGFTFDKAQKGLVIRRVTELLGVELDKRGAHGDQMQTMIDLLKETNGELTDEVKQLYEDKYHTKISGPMVRAARTRLGLVKPGSGSAHNIIEDLSIPVLKESMNLFDQYQKLLQKRAALESQIEELKSMIFDIDAQLEIYKPIANSLETIKNARDRVKLNLEEQALKARTQ